MCPIVNKMTFLEQYYYQDPNPCDEYLLSAICAICVRTMSILDRFTLPLCITELTEDEFLEMGNAFQEKAVSIFDYIYRRSRISSVQTLILLTMFVEPPASDSDDTSYWFKTGIAIRMVRGQLFSMTADHPAHLFVRHKTSAFIAALLAGISPNVKWSYEGGSGMSLT